MDYNKYLCGVYKDNDSHEPDYIGCSDSIKVNDLSKVLDEKIDSTVRTHTSEVMRESEFSVFTELLSEEASQISNNSNLIIECYNVDNLDDEMTYKLSSMYNINYPLDYNVDQLRLLIVNYPKIMRVRSQLKSYLMMLRILERSESELYSDDSDDSEVKLISKDHYKIHNSRIKNKEFADYMLSKITRTGIQFEFDNDNSHVYSASAVTTIDYGHGSYMDESDIKDDMKSSEVGSLITDKRGDLIKTYNY